MEVVIFRWETSVESGIAMAVRRKRLGNTFIVALSARFRNCSSEDKGYVIPTLSSDRKIQLGKNKRLRILDKPDDGYLD